MDEIPPTTAMDMTSNDPLGWNARDRKDPVAGTRRPPASAPIAPETANAVSFAVPEKWYMQRQSFHYHEQL